MKTFIVKDKTGFSKLTKRILAEEYDSRKHIIISEEETPKYKYMDKSGNMRDDDEEKDDYPNELGLRKSDIGSDDDNEGEVDDHTVFSPGGTVSRYRTQTVKDGDSRNTKTYAGSYVPQKGDQPSMADYHKSNLDVTDVPQEYGGGVHLGKTSKTGFKTSTKTINQPNETHEIEFADKPGQKFTAVGKDKDDMTAFNNQMRSTAAAPSDAVPEAEKMYQQNRQNVLAGRSDLVKTDLGRDENGNKKYLTPIYPEKPDGTSAGPGKRRDKSVKTISQKEWDQMVAEPQNESKVPDSWEDNPPQTRKRIVKARLAPKTIPGQTVSENLFSAAEIAHLRAVLETAEAPSRYDQAADVNQVSQKNILDEAGRGRPPKEGSPAWHKRQKEAAADNPNAGQGRDPRQHIQVVAGQAMGGRVMDFKHNDGSVSKITPPMGRRIVSHLGSLKPAERQSAVNKMHDSAEGLKV